jgi:hypothetical protein
MRLGSGRMPSSSGIEAIPIGKIALERGAETGKRHLDFRPKACHPRRLARDIEPDSTITDALSARVA